MFSIIASIVSYPVASEVQQPVEPVDEIPSDWESGGTSSGTCVVA
jgi:hypothetical protein